MGNHLASLAVSGRTLFAILLPLALAAVLVAMASGDTFFGPTALWHGLTGDSSDLGGRILWELRMPRVAAAFVAGALLALAGLQMQVLLGNPLADPYILGISGGAAVAALGALWLDGGPLATGVAAFSGALLSTLLVFSLARDDGNRSSGRLLLTGVVTAAGWGALIVFILTLAPPGKLRGMLFWLTGDLSFASLPTMSAVVLLIGLIVAWSRARALNLLVRGEVTAAASGVDTRRLRRLLYFNAALLTATAVTLGGTVGFVGLVVPHLLRLLAGSDHRVLVPAAVLGGGTLLVVADTLARTMAAPQQLPVGVLTAFIGVPLFLLLLRRQGHPG